MPEIPEIKITVTVTIDDADAYGVTLNCAPMLPTHEMAKLFEVIASEIRQGRINGLTIRPLDR